MFDGIEVDVISLGDADCIVVTQWVNSFPHRVLIDGGCGADAEIIIEFLRYRNYTEFWAALCTHPHNDHARGLIKVVQSKYITIHHGLMHDITQHVAADTLRRASAADDGVREVVETTQELAGAFSSRGIVTYEPFAGLWAKWPAMTVLGPSLPYYNSVLEEFTKMDVPIPSLLPFTRLSGVGSILGGNPSALSGLGGTLSSPSSKFMIPSPPQPKVDLSALLVGALSNSSVQEKPKTQPFNNTSVILGVVFNGSRLLFTADAGVDALDRIPADCKNLKWMQVPHHGSDGNLSQSNIERFCPEFAYISARGDSSHPSRAIVNGLIKVGAQVFSTHSLNPGHLWFAMGSVPYRGDYDPAVPLKATRDMKPFDWISILSGVK